jgi:hypothetical protein
MTFCTYFLVSVFCCVVRYELEGPYMVKSLVSEDASWGEPDDAY